MLCWHVLHARVHLGSLRTRELPLLCTVAGGAGVGADG